jgi:hypothetical protein
MAYSNSRACVLAKFVLRTRIQRSLRLLSLCRIIAHADIRLTTLQDPEVNDRRGAKRFPLELDVQYRVLHEHAVSGRTINISSNGVLFTTCESLAQGVRVEMAIDWPVRLEGRVRLRLVAIGIVVRTDGATAAVRMARHHFRTAGVLP